MELVILSGKGGTGKTTIVAALSELVGNTVKADCDVDAPNLYLFYQGRDIEKRNFYGGKKARINKNLCIECEICEEVCRFHAIENSRINLFSCEGCGACTLVCPQKAISLVEEKTADTFITKTKNGIVSRAMMGVGSDGSGKLVTCLRKNANRFAEKDTITLIDGSPGIGCSVIASVTGANAALIVTEPTISGLSDLKRILELTEHFNTLVMVCINKYDINFEMSNKIEDFVLEKNLSLVGKIPFDGKVMESVNRLIPITEFKDSSAKNAIVDMWIFMTALMKEKNII